MIKPFSAFCGFDGQRNPGRPPLICLPEENPFLLFGWVRRIKKRWPAGLLIVINVHDDLLIVRLRERGGRLWLSWRQMRSKDILKVERTAADSMNSRDIREIDSRSRRGR